MKKLEDKTVLITGGASGIGRIMVRLLLERKAKVIIWDIIQRVLMTHYRNSLNKGRFIAYNVDVLHVEPIPETAKKVSQK